MKHSESIAKLAAALVAAQAELRAVGMDAVNPHFKAKYASLDNIIETIRPTLARHKLAVVQGATLPESNSEGKVTGFTVETMLVHESGEWLTSGVVMPIAKADPQGAGAAITYGRRYGLSAILSLATDEDDDGNAASKQRSGAVGGRTSGSANADRGSVGQTPARETGTAPATQSRPASNTLGAEDYVMPLGKQKGSTLGQIATDDLVSAAEWIESHSMTKKYGELLTGIRIVLAAREVAAERRAS